MDAVFDAQFRLMKDEFSRRGIRIEVALRPDGEADYLYQEGHLLALSTDENLGVLTNVLPGLRGTQQHDLRPDGALTTFTNDELQNGELSVPEALELIDRQRRNRNLELAPEGVAAVSPDHVVHIARICPAVEPEVPSGNPVSPWPAPRADCKSDREILIGVSDTGLLGKLDLARYTWLKDVTGDPDPLGPVTRSGLPRIPAYTGHGTFVAGIAKSEAPQARVLVNDHFSVSGGELESVIVGKIEELVRAGADVINLSAGTYTRNNWSSLGFDSFNRRHPEIAFVADMSGEWSSAGTREITR